MKGSAGNKEGNSVVGLEGEPGSSVGAGTVTMSKKAKKLTYEKQLEEINKELQLKSSTSNPWKGAGVKRQRMKPEQEVMLLEQKWILLLKLKRHTEVIDDGYSIVGRMGPIVVIYKCILIALVRLGKTEDDLVELLEAWKKAAPKCPHFTETKRIFDGYFAALRSGMKHSDIFSSIEDALGLNANLVLSKQSPDITDDKKWRFRVPPPRHTTFSLCPRCSSGNSCIYGDDCLFAHSNEELKEWKMRAEGDKKNNNNPQLLEEDPDEHSSKSSGKKRQIPNSYRHLLIPPLCIHYLQELGKHIKEAADVKNVLTDDINGAKFKVAPALHFQRRLDGVNKVQCTWSFMVISKMPMGTVTILHDASRERFRISAATFYNKKKETIDLIDLHPNNKVQAKLQVLNTFIQPPLFLRFNSGWPDTCYYKIEVTYESRDPFPEPGLFRQSVVFDFKKEPKVAKHISIEVLPKVEPIGNHLTEANRKTVWGVSPASISPIDFNSNSEFSSGHMEENDSPVVHSTLTYEPEPDEFINRSSDFPSLDQCLAVKVNGFNSKSVGAMIAPPTDFIFDSETGKVVTVKGVPLRLDCDGGGVFRDQENIFLDDVPLTKENYCTWMRDFLEVELKARQRVVGDLKKVVEIRILGEYTATPECLYKYDSTVGEVYGKIEALSSIFSGDTKLERLLGLNCSNVVISHPEDKTPKRFLCKVIEKSNSVLVLAIGRKAADELLLLSNTTRQLQIQFVLDPIYIDTVKRSLEVLNKYHMDFLFPSFDSELFPFLKTVDGVGMIYHEEQSLNARQLNVYNLLIGRKVLIDGMARPPPLLLLGGVSTGKSFVIAHCIRALVRPYIGIPPNRILICTQTDFAADAYITDYLHPWLINDQLSIQRSKPLRIYGEDRFVDSVSGVIKHYCLFNDDGTSFRYPTLEEILAHKTVIVTLSTCAELIRLGCDEDTFSHIVLDEVGPCLEAEYVQPIVLAGRDTKLLIAGDVMRTKSQMFSVSKGVPPLSLLERLRNIYTFRHPFVVNLVDNYVNHEVIVKFLSEVYYYNQLRSASSQLSHPTHYPLSFHHVTSGRELQADNGRGCYNMEEISHIVGFVEELLRTWPDKWGSPKLSSNVVIFTPYHNQVLGLKVQLQLKGIHEIDVKLLSQISGPKYKVVIMSTVRTYKQCGGDVLDGVSDGGFFTDRRLLFNVIGCARNMVVTFGDAGSLWNHGACSDIWQKYLTECHRHNSIKGFKAKTGQHLKTEDGFIIGAPLPTRQQGKVSSAVPAPEVKGERASTQAPPPLKSCSSQTIGQATLIHAHNISPSHGLEFSVNGIDSSPTNSNNDHSWNIPSSSMQAPKSDLFSAFSVNTEPLYNSRSPLTLSQEVNMIGKLPFPDKFPGKGFDDNSIQGSVFKPLTLNGMTNPLVKHSPEPKIENVVHRFSGMKFEYQKGIQSNVNKPLEVYRSPFQLPSVSPTLISEERTSKFAGAIGTPNKPEEKMLNVPEPKTTPRPLFDKNFMFDNSDSHFSPMVAPKPVYEPRSIPPLTKFENSLMTPVHKGPPGFAPIPSLESKIGNFSYPENKLSYSSPQHKATHGSGLTSTKGSNYRRNVGFEIPPRMLKNLHLSTPTNYRSPTRSKGKPLPSTKAAPPPEMNFFEELGLSSQPHAEEDISRCESAASSTDDHSFIDGDVDEAMLIVENMNNESEGLFGRDEWIQVKNSKKGKHHQQHLQQTRKSRANKHAPNRVNGAGGEVSAEITSELHLDDKVDIISQMGYPRALAIKALQICDKDLSLAADWVVSNYEVSSS